MEGGFFQNARSDHVEGAGVRREQYLSQIKSMDVFHVDDDVN